MLGESDGIVEGVSSGSGHGEAAGGGLQHAALDRTESRRRLGAMVDVASERVLTVVNGSQVFHGGVPGVDHHVPVVGVQAGIHERGRLGGRVLGSAVVGVGRGRVHL